MNTTLKTTGLLRQRALKTNKVDQDLLFLSKLSPFHTNQARSSKLGALIFG